MGRNADRGMSWDGHPDLIPDDDASMYLGADRNWRDNCPWNSTTPRVIYAYNFLVAWIQHHADVNGVSPGLWLERQERAGTKVIWD